MPSYFRQRSSSPTYTFVIPDGATTKTVDFVPGPTPVTSISRPLTNPELWTLYYFETHARSCSTCGDPYSVHRAGNRLCDKGHGLAQGVARIVWSRGNGRETYDATATGGRLIRVEMPQDYDETRSLLKAMERSLRHRHQRPIVSFDRTTPPLVERAPKTVTRTPERKRSVKENSPNRITVPKNVSPSRAQAIPEPEPTVLYEKRAPEIVDWPEAEYEIREPSRVIQPNQSPSSKSARPHTPKKQEQQQGSDLGASPTKPTASPSRRVSFQPTPTTTTIQPISYSAVPATSTPARPRSTTMPRPHSMVVDPNTYNVEVREPKGRSKRRSALFL